MIMNQILTRQPETIFLSRLPEKNATLALKDYKEQISI